MKTPRRRDGVVSSEKFSSFNPPKGGSRNTPQQRLWGIKNLINFDVEKKYIIVYIVAHIKL
jgi:hypothetical protein